MLHIKKWRMLDLRRLEQFIARMGVEAYFTCSAEFFLSVTKATKWTTRRSQPPEGLGKERAGQREQWITSVPHFALLSILEWPGSRKWDNHHHTIFITIVCRKERNVFEKYLAHFRWLISEYFYSFFIKAQSILWRLV